MLCGCVVSICVILTVLALKLVYIEATQMIGCLTYHY